MRTKALLLTAALGFAGVATSMAQAVYSVNVVGYINLTLKPGYNMVANQLKASPNNKLGSVLPGALSDSLVQKFANNNYTTDLYDGTEWVDSLTSLPSTTTLNPGEGFFFFNPAEGDTSVTLVGEVTTGNNLTVNFAPGYNLSASIVPQQISLTAANGFNAVGDMLYQTFNAANQSYDTTLLYDGTDWTDILTSVPVAAPAPNVGQGFFLFNPNEASVGWTRSFNPNN